MSKCILDESAEFGYTCQCDVSSGFIKKLENSSKSPGYGKNNGCEWAGKIPVSGQNSKPKPVGHVDKPIFENPAASTTVAPTTETAPDGQKIWPSRPNVDNDYKNNPVTFGLGWAATPPKPDTQLYGIEGIKNHWKINLLKRKKFYDNNF